MKMKILTSLITTVFTLWTIVCFSQNNENANELDKKYTPNAASIFNNSTKSGQEVFAGNETDIKNVFKFSPTFLLRQRVALIYEREVKKGITLNVAAGKPFGSDAFQRSFFSIGSSVTEFGTIMTPYDAMKQSIYWGSLPLMMAGCKFYFSGNTFDELYLSINYHWERLYYLLDEEVNGRRIEGENDVTFKMHAFNLGFGYTGLAGNKNNFTHEFFINFGAKLFKYTAFEETSVKSVNGFPEIVYKKNGDDQSARIMPSFNIGYMLGFGF